MIRDLMVILRLVSRRMENCHPLIQDIRYEFHRFMNKEPIEKDKWMERNTWGYNLKGFLKILTTDKRFRKNVIRFLEND